MTKEKMLKIDETARKISCLINTLCKEESVLTKDTLLNRFIETGVPLTTATKILMPLRKKGYISVSRGGLKTDKALFVFKKRIQPIYYKEFELILIKLRQTKAKPVKQADKVKDQPWVITCTIPQITIKFEIKWTRLKIQSPIS